MEADDYVLPALHMIDGNWSREPRPEYRGLTVRDHIAIEAMKGMLSNSESMSALFGITNGSAVETSNYVATAAYLQADAMIEESNK